jgi:glucose/mannose transport system substrate-binding protein
VSRAGLDPCEKESIENFDRANARDAAFGGSGEHLSSAEAGAIQDVVLQHFNSDMSSADAVKLLSEAVSGAR